jgi:hypothetical protein
VPFGLLYYLIKRPATLPGVFLLATIELSAIHSNPKSISC